MSSESFSVSERINKYVIIDFSHSTNPVNDAVGDTKGMKCMDGLKGI